jgi:hypothetical protein
VREADNLPPYSADVNLTLLDPSGPAWPVMGVLYLYLLYNKIMFIKVGKLMYVFSPVFMLKTATK